MLYVLPSDIARLILDYAERMSWDRTAAQMLKEIPELKEIAQMRRQHGKQARTLRWQQSLDGILSDYMAAKETVTEACEKYPYIFQNVPSQETLAKQIDYMIKRVSSYTKQQETTSNNSHFQSQSGRSKVQNMILRTEQNVPKQKEVYVNYSQDMGFEQPISEPLDEQSGKDASHCNLEVTDEVPSTSQTNLISSAPKTSKLSPKRKCHNVRKRNVADSKQYQEQLLENVFNNTDFPERLADCINKTLANKNYYADEGPTNNQSQLRIPDKMYIDTDCNNVCASNKMPHNVITETVNKILDDPISVCLFDELGMAPMHSKSALPIPSPPNRMLNTPIPQHDLNITQDNNNDMFDYQTEVLLSSPPHPNVLHPNNSEKSQNALAGGYQYSNSHVLQSNPSLLKSSEPMNSFQSYPHTNSLGTGTCSINRAVSSDSDGALLHQNSPSLPSEPSYSSADVMQLPPAALPGIVQVSRDNMNCSLPILPTVESISTNLHSENNSTSVNAVDSSPRLPVISMSIPGFDNTKDKMKELAQKNSQLVAPQTSTKIILVNTNYIGPANPPVVKKPLIPKSISSETLTRPMTVTLPNRVEVKIKKPITAASFNAAHRKKKKQEEQKKKETILNSTDVSETRSETHKAESLASTESDASELVMAELPIEDTLVESTQSKVNNNELQTNDDAGSAHRKKKQNAKKSLSPGIVSKTLELLENPSTNRSTTRSQSAMKTSVPGKQLLSTRNSRGSQSTPSHKKKSHIRVLEFKTPPKSGFKRFSSRSPKRASTRSLFSCPIDQKNGDKNVHHKDQNTKKRKLTTILEMSHDNVDGDSVMSEPLPKKVKKDEIVQKEGASCDEGASEIPVTNSNDELGSGRLISINEDSTTTFSSLKTPCKSSSLSLEAQTPFAGAEASTCKSIGTVSKYDLNTPLLPPIGPLMSPIKTPNYKSLTENKLRERTFTQDENSVSSIVNNAGLDLFDEASLDVGTFKNSENSPNKKMSKSNSDSSSKNMSPTSLGIELEKAIEKVCVSSGDSPKSVQSNDEADFNESIIPLSNEDSENSNDLVIPVSSYDNMHINHTVNINLPNCTPSTTQLMDIVDHLESANIVDGSFFVSNEVDINSSPEKTKKSKQNSSTQIDGEQNCSPKNSDSKDFNESAVSFQKLFGSDYDSDSDFATPIKTKSRTSSNFTNLTPKSKNSTSEPKNLTPKSKNLIPKSKNLNLKSKNLNPKSKSQTLSNTKRLTPSKTEDQTSIKIQNPSPSSSTEDSNHILKRNSLKNEKSVSTKCTNPKNKSKSDSRKHSNKKVDIRRSSRIAKTSHEPEKVDLKCELKQILETNINENPEAEANLRCRTPGKDLKQKSPAKAQNFWMNWSKRFSANEEDLNDSLPDISSTEDKFEDGRKESYDKCISPNPYKSNCEEGSLSQSYIELESQLARLDGAYDGTGVPDTPGKSLSVFAYLPKTPEKELATICRSIVKDNPKAMAVVPSCSDISNNCNTDYSSLSHAALSKSSQLYSGQTINDLLSTSPNKCDSNAVENVEEPKVNNSLPSTSRANQEENVESDELYVVEDELEVNLFLSELVVLTQLNIVDEENVLSYPPEISYNDQELQDAEKLSPTKENDDVSVCEDIVHPNKIQPEEKQEEIHKETNKSSKGISKHKVAKAPKKKSKKGGVKSESKSKRSNCKENSPKSEATIDPILFSQFREKIMAENRSKARTTDVSDEDLPLSVLLKKKKKESHKAKGKSKSKDTGKKKVKDRSQGETKKRNTNEDNGDLITSNKSAEKACNEAKISALSEPAESSTVNEPLEISTHDQSFDESTALKNIAPESCEKLVSYPRHPKFQFTDTMCSDAATPSHLNKLPTTSTPLIECLSSNVISTKHPNILGSGSYFPEEPKTPEKFEQSSVTNSQVKKTLARVTVEKCDEVNSSNVVSSEGVLGTHVTKEESSPIAGAAPVKRKLDAENNENALPSKKSNSLLKNKSRIALMKTIHKIYQKK